MKGTYITLQGKCVKILDFDAVNKMAYVDFGEGDIHWVGEPEYKDWAAPTYIPDHPAQMTESQAKSVEEIATYPDKVTTSLTEPVIEEKLKRKRTVKNK